MRRNSESPYKHQKRPSGHDFHHGRARYSGHDQNNRHSSRQRSPSPSRKREDDSDRRRDSGHHSRDHASKREINKRASSPRQVSSSRNNINNHRNQHDNHRDSHNNRPPNRNSSTNDYRREPPRVNKSYPNAAARNHVQHHDRRSYHGKGNARDDHNRNHKNQRHRSFSAGSPRTGSKQREVQSSSKAPRPQSPGPSVSFQAPPSSATKCDSDASRKPRTSEMGRNCANHNNRSRLPPRITHKPHLARGPRDMRNKLPFNKRPKFGGGATSAISAAGSKCSPNSRSRITKPKPHLTCSPQSPLKRKRKVGGSITTTATNGTAQPASQEELKRRRINFPDEKPAASNSLIDELSNTDTNADDYEDAVEKWVRSAPDELYYTRQLDGHATATERTQTLCEKFKQALLVRSRESREVAEALGAVRMAELIQIENAQLAEQRQMKKSKKSKKCCHGNKKHDSSSDADTTASTQCEKAEKDNAVDQDSSAGEQRSKKLGGKDTKISEDSEKVQVQIDENGLTDKHLNVETEAAKSSAVAYINKNKDEPQESVCAAVNDVNTVEVEKEKTCVVPSQLNAFESEDPISVVPNFMDAETEPVSPMEADEESMEEGELADSMDENDPAEVFEPSDKTLGKPQELNVNSTCNNNANAVNTPTESSVIAEVQPMKSAAAQPPLPPTPEKPPPPPPVPQVPKEIDKSKDLPKTVDSAPPCSGCCSGSKEDDKHKDKQKQAKKKNQNNSTKKKKADADDSSDSDDDDDSGSSSSSSTESTSEDSSDDEEGFSMTRSDTANRELERRKKHPRRLHLELWHNDPGLMNDGPVCRCSAKARRFGIRHGFYPGEDKIPFCNLYSNNKDRLYHYRITISPPKNFLISTPTVINHDGHEYIFEGFSIFSHYKLDLTLPPCKVIRFNIRYDVFVEEERFPESFCVNELLLFETYLFREILELVDLKYDWNDETGCSQFHLMPRFVRRLPDNGQEILSMSRVLIHLLKSDKELVKEEDLHKLYTVEQKDWQNFADRHKGTIVTKWGVKPCAVRVDQIDRDVTGQELQEDDGIPFPLIVHFGIRPPQLSYAGNAGYQRAWRRYVKYRHLLSNMPKPSPEDKIKLLKKEMKLQAMRTASSLKRDVTVAISSKGFRTTGICCDLVQHAMLIPVLVAHLRFHKCLETLEKCMIYPFQNRYLLQLAMTHPSYRENFGTNPDHARNALTNCGIRQPEYGDRRIHYAYTRKRGINTLINIMARFGADQETESDITHNERLEFLGDAVVEFVTSIHLFHIFPDLEEGGLATYRAAIVQNQHLAVLAQALNLDQYMLYAHGSDLCHDSELRHAMANCFEALMGALFLDGGIEAADRVFGNTLFGNQLVLLDKWTNYPKHPLQQEEPAGDRSWISSHDVLQKLAEFERNIGIQFNHIRLLARAFTDRSLGYNNLTRGSNQRLEFLGDTVLQLISSEYLYRHFPDHHEGHLSLLRSSLVNNRTQSHVCDDLGMPHYAMRGDPKSEMKTKDRADLLEAFLGALYIDKGLKYCHLFCQVCFFPRLSNSITKQEWNDPKSKLQQCCLTLRAMNGKEPDIPQYKVIQSIGPTNTRTYIVAVYFRSKRLATARGHSIQEAEMNAASCALEVSGHLFPQLHHQKRIMDKTKSKPHK